MYLQNNVILIIILFVKGYTENVKVLLKYGGSARIKNKVDKTPYKLATEHNRQAVKAAIEKHEEKIADVVQLRTLLYR